MYVINITIPLKVAIDKYSQNFVSRYTFYTVVVYNNGLRVKLGYNIKLINIFLHLIGFSLTCDPQKNCECQRRSNWADW